MKKSTKILVGALLLAAVPVAAGFQLRKDSDNVAEYESRAIVQISQGNYEQAAIDYTKAILVKPTEASLYSNRGDIYRQLGYYQLAIFDYSQAIKLNPIPKHYEQRAKLWDNLQEKQKADADRKLL
jgi:Flp pilus assembly protein TadD